MAIFRIPALAGLVRHLDDPTDPERSSHHALIRLADLPPDIPKDVNPRDQNLNSRVSNDIREGLREHSVFFHLLNRGITIIASSAFYDTKRAEFVIDVPSNGDVFSDSALENSALVDDKSPHHGGSSDSSDDEKIIDMDEWIGDATFGIVDGGHTYAVIQQAKANAELDTNLARSLKNAFVRLEVLVGVDRVQLDEMRRLTTAIARARNTSAQVRPQAIANLDRQFDWLKDLLNERNRPYRNIIAYRENQGKAEADARGVKMIDIRDVVQLLTIFHPKFLTDESQPVIAYSSAERCLMNYINEQKQPNQNSLGDVLSAPGYKQLAPIASEILEFYAFLLDTFKDNYRLAGGKKALLEDEDEDEDLNPPKKQGPGKANRVPALTSKSKLHHLYFLEKYSGYDMSKLKKHSKGIPHQGLVLPLLGGFRALAEVQADGNVGWKVTVPELIEIYQENAQKYVKTVFTLMAREKDNPQQIGKDASSWQLFYALVNSDYSNFIRNKEAK
ncbi:MAG: AIPR family protein [Calditrichaeota bacterium]|nr:AIPR family protein [Calditrichota bacterium]MCB9369093.1 AIPR family protein [Calditrichota bacterium]